jgi:hypothetical protein
MKEVRNLRENKPRQYEEVALLAHHRIHSTEHRFHRAESNDQIASRTLVLPKTGVPVKAWTWNSAKAATRRVRKLFMVNNTVSLPVSDGYHHLQEGAANR